jgi:hypothetical protein
MTTKGPIMDKFEETFCSQCGQAFGPGDSGYSHCDQHKDVAGSDSMKPTVERVMKAFESALTRRFSKSN